MPHQCMVRVQNNLLRYGHGENSNFFAKILIALRCLLWNYAVSNANASIILARNSSSPLSSSMSYCQCVINCCLHVWAISTTCMQNFLKIQWGNLHAKLYKNMMSILHVHVFMHFVHKPPWRTTKFIYVCKFSQKKWQ